MDSFYMYESDILLSKVYTINLLACQWTSWVPFLLSFTINSATHTSYIFLKANLKWRLNRADNSWLRKEWVQHTKAVKMKTIWHFNCFVQIQMIVMFQHNSPQSSLSHLMTSFVEIVVYCVLSFTCVKYWASRLIKAVNTHTYTAAFMKQWNKGAFLDEKFISTADCLIIRSFTNIILCCSGDK